MLLHDLLEVGKVVVGHDVDRSRHRIDGSIRNGSIRRTDVGQGRLDRYLKRVVTTVVATLDLDDGLLIGDGARHANGVHRGLGSRVGEAQHVETKALLEAFGNLGGRGRRSHEQSSRSVEGFLDLRDHEGVEVTHQHGAKTHGHIEQLTAVDVGEIGTLGRSNRNGIGVPVLEARRHTEWQSLAGQLVVLCRLTGGRRELLPFGCQEFFDLSVVNRLGRCRDVSPTGGIMCRDVIHHYQLQTAMFESLCLSHSSLTPTGVITRASSHSWMCQRTEEGPRRSGEALLLVRESALPTCGCGGFGAGVPCARVTR